MHFRTCWVTSPVACSALQEVRLSNCGQRLSDSAGADTVHLRDFARSGHPPTLFGAFLYFDVSFMVWVLIGALGVYIARDLG